MFYVLSVDELRNVYSVGIRACGVKQIEMHTADAFVLQPSASDLEVAIGNLERYKSADVDQIQAEMIQAGGETLRSKNRELIKPIWKKKELPHQRKDSIVVPIHKKGHKTDYNNYRGI
jgi:hypothetical protein